MRKNLTCFTNNILSTIILNTQIAFSSPIKAAFLLLSKQISIDSVKSKMTL